MPATRLSSSSPASLTCAIVINFIAGGPVGMSIIGFLLRNLLLPVFLVIRKIIPILRTGQSTNLTSSTKAVVAFGIVVVLPPSLASEVLLSFASCQLVYKRIAATMRRGGTNRLPTSFQLSVNHAVKMPPSYVLLKRRGVVAE
jgi:hypothetical protein